MSKRDELIRDIESKQIRRREVGKMMRPNPLPTFDIGSDYNRSTMYSKYINEHTKLSDDIYRLTELVKLLPNEETPESKSKKEKIVSSIESKVSLLQNLFSKRSGADTQSYRELLDNQISDIQMEIEGQKLILSIL